MGKRRFHFGDGPHCVSRRFLGVAYSLIVALMSCSQHYEEGSHPPPKPPPISEAGDSPAGDSPPKPVAESAAVVSGTIRLAEGFDERVGRDAALFIIARPAPVGGPPLAVKRLAIPAFPHAYTLTQNDAMIAVNWDEIDALYVSAKIDADGQVGGAKTGDLEGIHAHNPVAPGAVDVDILIDKVH